MSDQSEIIDDSEIIYEWKECAPAVTEGSNVQIVQQLRHWELTVNDGNGSFVSVGFITEVRPDFFTTTNRPLHRQQNPSHSAGFTSIDLAKLEVERIYRKKLEKKLRLERNGKQ